MTMFTFGHIIPDRLPSAMRNDVLRTVTGGASGHPVAFLQGAFRKLDLIFYRRGQTQCVRPYRTPKQPDSLDQRTHRKWFRIAQQHWITISAIQREMWAGYANRNNRVFEYKDSYTNNGRHLLREVQLTRQQLGLELSHDAPTVRPIRSHLQVFQHPVAQANTFTFQVVHNVPNPSGMLLYVEISPATDRPTIKPHPKSYRPIKGKNPNSYVPLQESGAVYTITSARFSIPDGERYGMRLRVIDTEYISGNFKVEDFIREVEPVPPEKPASLLKIAETQGCETPMRMAVSLHKTGTAGTGDIPALSRPGLNRRSSVDYPLRS
jgi:hypothetical protein